MLTSYYLKNTTSIELIFAGSCNLKCSYCLIHKHPKEMKRYNDNIRESVLNGDFQRRLFERFEEHKEQITNISIWGGEPTINADIADKLLTPIFEFFPNIKEMMFSTNSLLGFERGIKPYIDCLQNISDNLNRNIRFVLQISIDGPKEITDKSRNRKDITEIILQNVKDTAEYAAKNCKNKFRLLMDTKPTVSPESWDYLLTNNKVKEWFEFFYNLSKDTGEIIKDNPNVEEYVAQGPTICTPYDYTKKDGLLYRDFIREIKKIDFGPMSDRYDKDTILPHYGRFWKDMFGNNNYPQGCLLCSAGLTSLSFDYEGSLMTCHKLYDDWKLGKQDYPAHAKNIQMIYNREDIDRIGYVMENYFSRYDFRKTIFDALMLSMVEAGEIDKKYLNPVLMHAAFIFANAQTCYAGESGHQTKNIYVPSMSLIRLLCNGALEEIIDYYEQ